MRLPLVAVRLALFPLVLALALPACGPRERATALRARAAIEVPATEPPAMVELRWALPPGPRAGASDRSAEVAPGQIWPLGTPFLTHEDASAAYADEIPADLYAAGQPVPTNRALVFLRFGEQAQRRMLESAPDMPDGQSPIVVALVDGHVRHVLRLEGAAVAGVPIVADLAPAAADTLAARVRRALPARPAPLKPT